MSQLLKVPYLLTQHKVMYHLPQPFLSVVPYPAHFLLTQMSQMSQVSQVSHFLKIHRLLTHPKATFHLMPPFLFLTLLPSPISLMSLMSQVPQTRLIAQAKSHNSRQKPHPRLW